MIYQLGRVTWENCTSEVLNPVLPLPSSSFLTLRSLILRVISHHKTHLPTRRRPPIYRKPVILRLFPTSATVSLIDPKLPQTYHKKSLVIHGLHIAGFANRTRHGTEVGCEQMEFLYDPYNWYSSCKLRRWKFMEMFLSFHSLEISDKLRFLQKSEFRSCSLIHMYCILHIHL